MQSRKHDLYQNSQRRGLRYQFLPTYRSTIWWILLGICILNKHLPDFFIQEYIFGSGCPGSCLWYLVWLTKISVMRSLFAFYSIMSCLSLCPLLIHRPSALNSLVFDLLCDAGIRPCKHFSLVSRCIAGCLRDTAGCYQGQVSFWFWVLFFQSTSRL